MKIKSLTDLKATREYLNRIRAEPRSLKTAVIRETVGAYWRDIATIRFSKEGDVKASAEAFNPTSLEQTNIKEEFKDIEWPEINRLDKIINPPECWKNTEAKNMFEFRDVDNKIVMVQQRIENKDGSKNYVPWTYWEDGEWRCSEPDSALPLFNAEKLRDAHTVFIHEGAKGARYCQWMVEEKTREAKEALAEHPWGNELKGAVHVGWIGGAMSPYRTDWKILSKMGIKRAIIVADNDDAGRSCVPAIAERLRMPTFMIQFTDEFPSSFDLGDKFPAKLFGAIKDHRHYVGPAYRDCLHPATWATDLVQMDKENKKTKPVAVLRDSFRHMWSYVEEADIFVCTEMPEIIRTEAILNKMLAPFSHSNDTVRLIVRAYRGRSTRICYRPDQKGLMVTFRGSSAINLHVPTNIKSVVGDAKPWEEFLDYLFVNNQERDAVKKWCATLIAKPEARMSYGLLLISEKQGVGKTTLGANILAPLVGSSNVGFPSENDILSNFNDWIASKRLVIVNEIYSGSSWKAYHSLKSAITDRDITVNQKYMRQYTIENWCHVLACSNSMRALKMENDDRRWFYPEVTEIEWPQSKFIEFRSWLEQGGLGIIRHWAEGYGDYVKPSERSPMTERKKELIEGSRSDAQREAAALAEALNDLGAPAAISIKEVVAWVRQSSQGKVFDSDYELKRAMVQSGLYCWPKRLKIGGRMQLVLINALLKDKVMRDETQKPVDIIRSFIKKPNELLEGDM